MLCRSKRSQRTLGYDVRESALRAILRWGGTLTRSVVGGVEFWLIVGITVTLTILIDLNVLKVPELLEVKDMASLMGPVLGLAIFTTVYYNGQAYARYEMHYRHCMCVDTTIKQFVSEALVNFGFDPALRKHIVKSAKYILASIFVFHVSSEDDHNIAPPEVWDFVARKGLLSDVEIEFVRSFPGSVHLLLHFWAQTVVDQATAAASVKAKFSPPERAAIANRTHQHITQVSESCMKLIHLQNLPIPFPYFHLMQANIFFSLMTSGFCCCLFASRTSAPTYCTAVLPFTVITFVLLGMRQLAYELSDPFGTHDVDFPAADFMRHTYDHVVALLKADSRLDPVPSHAVEIRPRHVLTPCKWDLEELPAEVEKSRFHMREALLTAQTARIWCHPENVHGARRLGAWLEELQGPEEEAVEGPTSEDSAESVRPPKAVVVQAPAAPAAPAPAPAPAAGGAPSVEVVVGITEKLKALGDLLESLPQVLSKAVEQQSSSTSGAYRRY